ncbi:MAG: DnaD domain protein [Chloroflexi bacterium]|nr:DnaD domain protein [Chloroflexota bacterium]
MKGFSGFPEGETHITPIPAAFFSELLPVIEHLPELKVTLYAFWSLHRKEGQLRFLTRADFAGDELFMRGLAALPGGAQAALDDALERAAARGTLLQVTVESSEGGQAYYFLNTPRGRAAVEGLTRGAWRPGGEPDAPVQLTAERPNAFVLYEQNIGPLTPMVAEVLRDIEETYPAAWIEDAIRIAVENNARRLAYVRAILDGWRTRGRDEREHRGDTQEARRRYAEGEFADYLKK